MKVKTIAKLGISRSPWCPCESVPLYADTESGWSLYLVDADGNTMTEDVQGETIDEIRANARLMAAAPELYECLRDAIKSKCFYCGALERTGGACRNVEGFCYVREWVEAMKKAGGVENVDEN